MKKALLTRHEMPVRDILAGFEDHSKKIIDCRKKFLSAKSSASRVHFGKKLKDYFTAFVDRNLLLDFLKELIENMSGKDSVSDEVAFRGLCFYRALLDDMESLWLDFCFRDAGTDYDAFVCRVDEFFVPTGAYRHTMRLLYAYYRKDMETIIVIHSDIIEKNKALYPGAPRGPEQYPETAPPTFLPFPAASAKGMAALND